MSHIVLIDPTGKCANYVGTAPETENFWAKYNGRVKKEMRYKIKYFDSAEEATGFCESLAAPQSQMMKSEKMVVKKPAAKSKAK